MKLLETISDNRKLTFKQAKNKALISAEKGLKAYDIFKQTLPKTSKNNKNLKNLKQLSIWHVIKIGNEYIEVSEKALRNHKSLFCTNG